METYSSVEELIIKTRKPYTITKQRERWTDEEHSRFLEALKLYGRAWQRIEEHIGTKTAVQIRSHAQKFFSKLEKEALVKGASLGQTLDIKIPPPRPKRKPTKPYPLKTNASVSTSSLVGAKQTLNVETDSPLENPTGTEKLMRAKESLDEESASEVLTFSQEAPCASISSASKSYIQTSIVQAKSCNLREFVPSSVKEISDQGATDNCMNEAPKHEKQVNGERTNEVRKPEKLRKFPTDETQPNQSFPRHVPVHIVDGSPRTCVKTPFPDMFPSSILYQGGAHLNPSLFTNPTSSITTEHQSSSSRSSFHQSMPNFPPPFIPFVHNQDTYQSLLNVSPTFPSLVVPNVAPPSLAGSFWPCTNVETTVDSPPNMVEIAAATVAAASAWWAAHGMFPLCPPFHPGFPSPTAPTTAILPVVNKEGNVNGPHDPPWEVQEQLDPEFSEAPKPQHSASKSPTLSSSDSEESSGARSNGNELKPTDHEQKPAPITGFHDSTKVKTRKMVDRSSCGSNSPSNSEVEKEALEKHEKGKDESKEPDELNNRRGRTTSNLNESWKEVSQVGRLAFQALFSREVLPQSFSPNKGQPQNSTEDGKQNDEKDEDDTLQLSLNSRSWEVDTDHPNLEKSELLLSKNKEKGIVSIGLGHGKLKGRRTGFKPYKRCSVEAKESRVTNGSNQGEENGPKRIRLEGEAST